MAGWIQPNRRRKPQLSKGSLFAMKRNFSFMLVFFVAACLLGLAQQAGYRDLTADWRAPEDHVPSPSQANCPTVRSTTSPAPQVPPEHSATATQGLQLTILQVSPPQLRIGQDFTAVLRLKNSGTSTLAIPWEPDGEQVTRMAKDGASEKYEVADVNFRLRETVGNKIPIFLETSGALFADPETHKGYVDLKPGNWLDFKVSGSVACGLPECLGDIMPDVHAVLSAWWYQRVLTHSVAGCSEDHGSYLVRQLDSEPHPLTVLKPSSK